MKISLALCAAIVAVLSRPAMAQPSFDCSKAGSTIKKTICADSNLSSLDRELSEAYKQALARAGDDAFVIRALQRRWLSELNETCDIREARACIREKIDIRISELKSESSAPGAKIKTLQITGASKTYDFKVRMLPDTSDNLDGYLDGPAQIFISHKGAKTPFQIVTMENIFFGLGNDGAPLTNTAPLYGNQGLINAGDFNFDGHEDFAVQDGHEGSYGGPSYSVFLYSVQKRQFVRNRPLRELTIEGLGFFGFDEKRKRLVVHSKSGCCYHELTEYKVEHDAPVPTSREIDDSTEDPKYVIVSHERYINGKWHETSRQRTPLKDTEPN